MATALDLIKSAMRKAGILTKTESPSSDEANDALDTLNAMLDSWSNDGLMIPSRPTENFTLSSGVSSYTIGTGGAFNTSRPIVIISAYIKSGGVDYPLTKIGDEEYANITFKTASGMPEYINYSSSYPLGTIKLYPTPSANDDIYLLSEKKIGDYSLIETVDLSPGYERAIVYNLAVELSTEYGVQVPESTGIIAIDSLTKIKSVVAKNTSLDCVPAAGSGNIETGWNN